MISGLTPVFRVLKLYITSYDQHRFRHKFQKNLPFWNCSIYVEALKLMSLNQSSEDVKNLKQLLYGSRNPKEREHASFAISKKKKKSTRTDLKSSSCNSSMAKEHFMQTKVLKWVCKTGILIFLMRNSKEVKCFSLKPNTLPHLQHQ